MALRARIPRDLVAAAVRECLQLRGRPIGDIRKAATHPGDAAARPFRDEDAWHSKPEIDRCVAARLKLDTDRVVGPSRDDNELYRSVSDEITRLRRSGHIQDWQAGSGLGVWRLTGPLPPTPPGALSTSTAEGGPFSAGAAPWPADPQAPLYCVFTGIIRSGRKDNTYKFALARALLEYCNTNREHGDSRLVVPYRYLAERFAEYYWRLGRQLGLKQTLKLKRVPEAVSAVHLVPPARAGAGGGGPYYGLDRADRADIEGHILHHVFGHVRRKTSMVVPRFQNVVCGPGSTTAGAGWRVAPNPVFYTHSDDDQEVRLKPAAFDFFCDHHHILMWVVLDGWVEFMKRANPLARIDEAIAKANAGTAPRAVAEPDMLMERGGDPVACPCCAAHRLRQAPDPYGMPSRLDAWSRIFGHGMGVRVNVCSACGRPLVAQPPAPRCGCAPPPPPGRRARQG